MDCSTSTLLSGYVIVSVIVFSIILGMDDTEYKQRQTLIGASVMSILWPATVVTFVIYEFWRAIRSKIK